jgi:CRISPR-associated protein Cas2
MARVCLDHGQRVQNSVFECFIESVDLVGLRSRLREVMDEEEDSVRLYLLGDKWDGRVEHYGVRRSIDPSGPLIV